MIGVIFVCVVAFVPVFLAVFRDPSPRGRGATSSKALARLFARRK